MSYKPIDCKRDQFRKYIESKGVIDTITKVLIKLLEAPVKPEHPIDFIRDNLGPTLAEKHRTELLEQQLVDCQQEVRDLKAQVEQLQKKLSEKEATAVVPAKVTVAPTTQADSKLDSDKIVAENVVNKVVDANNVANKVADANNVTNKVVDVNNVANKVADAKNDTDVKAEIDADAKKPDAKVDETSPKPADTVNESQSGGSAAEAEQKASASEKAATLVAAPSSQPVAIETSVAEKADVATSNSGEVTPSKTDASAAKADSTVGSDKEAKATENTVTPNDTSKAAVEVDK